MIDGVYCGNTHVYPCNAAPFKRDVDAVSEAEWAGDSVWWKHKDLPAKLKRDVDTVSEAEWAGDSVWWKHKSLPEKA